MIQVDYCRKCSADFDPKVGCYCNTVTPPSEPLTVGRVMRKRNLNTIIPLPVEVDSETLQQIINLRAGD